MVSYTWYVVYTYSMILNVRDFKFLGLGSKFTTTQVDEPKHVLALRSVGWGALPARSLLLPVDAAKSPAFSCMLL